MHKEILNKEQILLLPLISSFKKEFYLVGGTAIALHIGHRRSIDFDLFKATTINRKKILNKVTDFTSDFLVTRSVEEQLNINVGEVKITFFEFPYTISSTFNFDNIINIPDLLTLAAMKAFALGRRSKWKDYVDLYFILKKYHSITEVINKAESIFQTVFSEKQFRAQLSYFDDIDYSESVDFLIKSKPTAEIKSFLIKIATEI